MERMGAHTGLRPGIQTQVKSRFIDQSMTLLCSGGLVITGLPQLLSVLVRVSDFAQFS